jgi:hypothetical protein
VERNVTSSVTDFINDPTINEIVTENEPDYERMIKRRDTVSCYKEVLQNKMLKQSNLLLIPSSRRKLKISRKIDRSA